ncbi:nucleoside recognition domain-containing protein [Thermosediminibacter litoriperuensis]|uniref:Ferrous iron transport protein B n=1 Tax=Thermosediminibacter litoriperuensis TaxID=291989 RepID=A0A5S5AZN6_9FIRM|nr:nucleoside recognition domain-containing protein [Thermosediminibacter litoriperuensis]TYP57834.1 ferrous iron transport protein B [Thermosediminibacter litoriperuensis]
MDIHFFHSSRETGDSNDISHESTDVKDLIVEKIYEKAESITRKAVRYDRFREDLDKKIDLLLTSRVTGILFMLLLLGVIFWLTLIGANYPSQLLAKVLFGIQGFLESFLMSIGAPEWVNGFLVTGMYRTLAWVVSVMLPPMAIFFPLFTFLEDLGYLPRVAFNLDYFFKRAGAHGKQALTMSMGFGCNAAGVVSCRIINSPRERMIAILTNNFVPCNGRFPTLILLASLFIGGLAPNLGWLLASLTVSGLVVFGILITLLVSKLLSSTLLKGLPSSFILELPPYRPPHIGSIIIRSIYERTLFVLGRAVAVAAPAGGIIWLLAHIKFENQSLLAQAAAFLDPLGRLMGLDGYILMAFIAGLPANEIVLPILLMGYLAQGTMISPDDFTSLKELLVNHGWTTLTAINTMLFSLLHFPCATTLWTIRSETGGARWAVCAAALTTAVALLVCFITASLYRLVMWVIF